MIVVKSMHFLYIFSLHNGSYRTHLNFLSNAIAPIQDKASQVFIHCVNFLSFMQRLCSVCTKPYTARVFSFLIGLTIMCLCIFYASLTAHKREVGDHVMPRERSPNRDIAKQTWIQNGGNMKLKDIAASIGVGETQIRKWKSQDKWEHEIKGNVTNATKGNVTKRGAPKGSKNAAGNHGGTGGPPRNDKAVKHGLFAKYLPADTLELVEALQNEDGLNRVKRNIAVLETQIIRAQSIMNVESKEELIKHLKKQTDGDTSSTREWEFQYAWDRQGNFLSSLARAMASLTGMYKLLAELTPDNPGEGVKKQVGAFVEALNGTAEDVWNDEEEA